MEYLHPVQVACLDEKQAKAYKKAYADLRRKMRALLADQDGKKYEGGLKNSTGRIAYFYDIQPELVNALIQENFFGTNRFAEIRKINDLKYSYERASVSDKKYLYDKYGNIPHGFRDYLSLPAMYYFYHYIDCVKNNLDLLRGQVNARSLDSAMTKVSTETFIKKSETRTYDLRDVRDLLSYAYDTNFNTPNVQNLYFSQCMLNGFMEEPIKSYTSISKQDEKAREDIRGNAEKMMEFIPIKWEITQDLLDYMISYTGFQNGLNDNEIADIRGFYGNKRAVVIKNLSSIATPAKDKMLDKYTWGRGEEFKSTYEARPIIFKASPGVQLTIFDKEENEKK